MNPEEEFPYEKKADVYNDFLSSAVTKHILMISDNKLIAIYDETGELINVIFRC